MPIRQEKLQDLKKRMEKLHIYEEDLIEKFILGSGKGGQKVNKSHTCVYLKHTSTGIEVKCARERTRGMNRFFARRMLVEKLEETKEKESLKIRKQKKRRQRRKKI